MKHGHRLSVIMALTRAHSWRRIVRICTYGMMGAAVLMAMGVPAHANDALEKALGAILRITNGRTSGTGFLVAVPGRADASSVILVTAAHVFEEMSESECQLILRTLSSDQTYARKEVSIAIRENGAPRWKRHAEMDVAALAIRLPADVAVTPLGYEQLADAAWVAEKKLRVGQHVWIPSYPAQLAANEAGWPILRQGTVASYPLSPVSQVKTILVDFNTFGGDSGAPVLSVSNDGCHVVGLVHGMHRQTDTATLPLQELTFHTPLGLSIVVQAAFLRDTIEMLTGSSN
jgi:hypothetical protein